MIESVLAYYFYSFIEGLMKVSVLGAGPAGSTAAYYLALGGIDVELIDKVKFPREKPCAGGLFNPELYDKDFPYLKNYDGKYIFNARFYASNGNGSVSFDYTSKTPLLKMVRRIEFDHFLLNNAIEAGAKFFIDKKTEGDVIINATGVKPPNYYPDAGICLVYDFPIDNDLDTVHIHYGFGGIMGYAWVYPKKGYANVGIGAYLPQKNIKKVYSDYIDFLGAMEIVKVKHKSYMAKIIPFAPRSRWHENNRIFVGDAAGFVNPSTGEGIYFAMLSGKIAAKMIIEGRDFKWYEEECRRVFGYWLEPIRFKDNRALLNKILKRAVKIALKDKKFAKMLTENFFRLNAHNLTWRFLLRQIF